MPTNAHEWITLGVLVLLGSVHGVLFVVWQSFGAYTERVERASALCRQSNELTRQSNWRTVDEIRADREQATLAAELTLERFVARVEQINDQRSA